jgi:hypothetical protein
VTIPGYKVPLCAFCPNPKKFQLVLKEGNKQKMARLLPVCVECAERFEAQGKEVRR